MATIFHTVPDYLAHLDPIKGQTMQTILDVITQNFPTLQLKIAWNVPQVCFFKTYVFGMAAFKNHLTLNPWSTAVMMHIAPRLSGYEVAKTTFPVPVD
jgi:uncharacterized protein YdhG (YjbR/CyaY superfamily)